VLGTLSGSVLDAATGTVLWDHVAAQSLLPASTAKLLTSAAALLSLGHQARLSTTVLRGTEPGSVVLVGGGDPTLSALPAGKESVYPGAPKLDDLVAQVKANAGQVRKVYYDVSRYTADGLAPGWDRGDVSGGNIAPIVPLMLDGARDRSTELDPPRNGAPAQAAAVEFAKRLGLAASVVAVGTATQGAVVLGKVESAPIEELVNNLLQISDNVLAEVIGREVARAAGAEPSFAGVTRTVLDVLAHNGFSTADVQMSDGSGLSTNDRVPARLLSAVLAVAASPNNADPRVAKLRSLLGGLPVAGGTGTLTGRYRDSSAGAGKGWVRAKTGTMTGANGLAGVVLDTEGRLLVFAFISNSAAPPDAVRPALDTMAATLRGCGCH
jgi:D-alanyl-D-alanine carboxypeptidase/D-alanyl-D-alanine-endopeptidase (penicillin-binding protein 4)